VVAHLRTCGLIRVRSQEVRIASLLTREGSVSLENDGYGWKIFAGILVILVGVFNVIDGLDVTNASQVRVTLTGRSNCRSRTTSDVGMAHCSSSTI
jgi:hypothetical protein